jgi:uncharacterized protein YneF (UPF0154 family)
MPKILLTAVLLLIGFSSGFGYLSYKLANNSGREEFWSELLLHFTAEFTVFAIGILITFFVASKLTEHKIKPLVELIAKLRAKEVILPETARGIVISAAKLISEEQLKKDISVHVYQKPGKCDVCALDIGIREDKRCRHCGLKDHIWNIKEDPEEV